MMGLPQNIDSLGVKAGSGAQSNAAAANRTAQAPSISSLPPAAIELASKLFDFAREGQTAALSQYLDAGIPVNLTNHKGDTLLMLASYHGHADTAAVLLSKGADPDVLNDRGQSVMAGAVFKNHEDVVRVLHSGEHGKKADVWLGQPSAVDAAKMFRLGKYLELFGVEDDGRQPWEAEEAAERHMSTT